MTLSLDHKDFLMALLDGAWYNCKPLPLEIGKSLKEQDPNNEVLYIEDKGNGAMYCELWTKEGWANEQQRQIYLATFKEAAPLPKVKPPTRDELMTQLMDSINKGDLQNIVKLQEHLKNI